MIEPKDLRIGNYINEDHIVMGITLDMIETDKDAEMLLEYVEPIPLTEDWLEKFGFYINNNGEPEIVTHEQEKLGLSISISVLPYKYTAWHCDLKDYLYYPIAKCQYVHQLQNLYYARKSATVIPVGK